MTEVKVDNIIDCSNLATDAINATVKDLLKHKFNKVILKNITGQTGLLEGLRNGNRIEIIGDVDSFFANSLEGTKIIVNGNVGDVSCGDVVGGKFAIWGSTGKSFGNKIGLSEFYIFRNCASDSFNHLSVTSKVVVGGLVGKNFACNAGGGTIIILNLKGGRIIIDDTMNWFTKSKNVNVYLRGDVVIDDKRFSAKDASDCDEDIYLPLISEFARLFQFSLDKIKSKKFNKLNITG